MSDSSDISNLSEFEPIIDEEMSESEPAMTEEEEEGSHSENDDVTSRQLSLKSGSPNEEIFSFDTRGRTKVVKKKPRLETSKTKRSYATKSSSIAAKTKSSSHGGTSSVPPKKHSSGSRSWRPRSRSLATGILSTPSPHLNSNVCGGSRTVPQTEPKKMLPRPRHTPTTRQGGRNSSTDSSSQNKPEDYPEQSDSEEEPTTERPISSVLGKISNMLGTVIDLKKLNQS